jgi:hypothetical protein
VIIRGTTSRITITLAGSEGTSFEDMTGSCGCIELGVVEVQDVVVRSNATMLRNWWLVDLDDRRQVDPDDAMFDVGSSCVVINFEVGLDISSCEFARPTSL